MGKKKKSRSVTRRFTEEYKREAVRLWLEGGRSQREICRELEIAPASLRKWARQISPSAASAQTELVDVSESPEAELSRLRKRVRELEMEREILKKAAAFFAKESE